MQRSSSTSTDCTPSTIAGLMAAVGQEETVVGILAEVGKSVVGDLRHHAVDAEEGDVGAVHGAAHVEAAGDGDAELGRQLLFLEVLDEVVHDHLDEPRGVGGGGVAVNPALGVDDVGDGVVHPADGELGRLEVLEERLDVALVAEEKLHVVAAGEAQVAVAVLVGEVGELPDEIGADETRRGGSGR